ncbi:MAG: hypothetical protein IKP53_08530 [Candidatus Methanomethylophilaceae archaeon]|nr:hypothetical protein [Candidatus Methanomethylophilaceae archaeon]
MLSVSDAKEIGLIRDELIGLRSDLEPFRGPEEIEKAIDMIGRARLELDAFVEGQS